MTVPVMRSKRGTFVVDEDNLPDVEIEASMVLARLKKILGLLDLIPPTEATERGFRLVRHEVVEFSERILWLQKYASEAGDSKGLPPPSGAKEGNDAGDERFWELRERRRLSTTLFYLSYFI